MCAPRVPCFCALSQKRVVLWIFSQSSTSLKSISVESAAQKTNIQRIPYQTHVIKSTWKNHRAFYTIFYFSHDTIINEILINAISVLRSHYALLRGTKFPKNTAHDTMIHVFAVIAKFQTKKNICANKTQILDILVVADGAMRERVWCICCCSIFNYLHKLILRAQCMCC